MLHYRRECWNFSNNRVYIKREMTTKNRILVSVIIPVYNHASELKRAIESVLNQTEQNFEVIVVDDGSEENIKEITDSFNDERISLIKNENHGNANVARNRGIAEARGEFVAMLDADDEYLPEHLKQRVDTIKTSDCDGIFGSAYLFDGAKQKVKFSRPRGRRESMADFLLTDGFCPTPSHFYKANAARQIRWDKNLYRNQDYDFSIRFAREFKFICDTRPTVRVHWHIGYKQKLNNTHFASQKLFIEKHKEKISRSALVNYLKAMQKEAVEIGNRNQQEYYRNELAKEASTLMTTILIGLVKIKSVKNRVLRFFRG